MNRNTLLLVLIFGAAAAGLGGLVMATGKLSKSALLSLAQGAGFPPGDDNTAAAIALAESSGDAHAYNPESAAGNPQGQGSFGLWQINLHAHPEFFTWPLYDPATNARAAFSVYEAAGNSFHPWSTFTSGAYQSFV